MFFNVMYILQYLLLIAQMINCCGGFFHH